MLLLGLAMMICFNRLYIHLLPLLPFDCSAQNQMEREKKPSQRLECLKSNGNDAKIEREIFRLRNLRYRKKRNLCKKSQPFVIAFLCGIFISVLLPFFCFFPTSLFKAIIVSTKYTYQHTFYQRVKKNNMSAEIVAMIICALALLAHSNTMQIC